MVCHLLADGDERKQASAKAQEQNQELKAKVKDQEGTIARLRADIASMESKIDILLKNKELEIELRERKKIEDAYSKGFEACKEQFLALKKLQAQLLP